MTFEINFTDTYPVTKRSKHQNTYHGITVPDPYDYMEDPDYPDTKKFVKDNNNLFNHFIDQTLIHKYQEVFAKYIGFPLYFLPSKHEGKYFFTKQDGKQPQGKFYAQNISSSQIKELFDFNTLSADGTSSSLVTSVSPNGNFLATTVSKHGSDWQDLLVINLATGSIQETIPWVNFTEICWRPDNYGFYYAGFPDQNGLPLEEQRRNQKVFYHILGTDFKKDFIIFDPKDKDFTTDISLSSDNQWLVFSTNKSTMPENKLLLKRIESDDPIITVISGLDGNSYEIIDIIEQTAYCLTSWNAPNKRLMKFKINVPDKESWIEVIPENSNVLDDVHIANNNLVLVYIEKVKHAMYRFTLDGQKIGTIPLPGIGSIIRSFQSQLSIECQKDDTELFFSFTSFFDPCTIYRFDFTTE